METLKIWFADFWPEWNNEDFITPILRNHFNIVLDKNNPDVLFHSIFNRMSETSNYKCKKILYLGENWRPEQFKSNYSISFDPCSNTNFRLPLWQVYLLLNPDYKNRLYNRKNWKREEFKRWCAFTVSNPSNFMRNSAYHTLSSYRYVDSYGRYLTNSSELQEYSKGKYWRDAKDNFFLENPHEFMMAFENSPYRYYCTEKLMDAFLVGAMPIYWGDTRVSEDWNKDAFIDVCRQDLDIVKNVDKDKGLFKSMYEQPVFTDEQKKKLEDNLLNFKNWLIDIVKR